MVDKDFKMALSELRMGRVPSNLTEVTHHAYKGLTDALAFHEAAMECVERMQNDIIVLRERMEKCSKS